MAPIYIYIHICTKNTWMDVLNTLIVHIMHSKLYDVVSKIKCFVLGTLDTIPECLKYEKIEICKVDTDYSLYERFTLKNLYDDSIKEDFYVLYLHTKGITYPDSYPVNDWVNYLIYFNVYKHRDAIENLHFYDTVGVNLQNGPHYSGNFWWSKSSHIKKLNREIGINYIAPEIWITSIKSNVRYLGLWLSCVDHYRSRYPPSMYINKGFKKYEFPGPYVKNLRDVSNDLDIPT